ncbi:hypothetical protein VTI74DRAFT_2920 [Chaetomium olivicolor]
MSYGTRSGGGLRRKVSGEEDPNVIPRTAPLGFLGRLPFKIVGSLRYKPSAANLREHPGGGGTAQVLHAEGEERQPLLGAGEEEDAMRQQRRSPQQGNRPRSDTTTSDNTSSSYRSRGDLFPSDGEGEEDAVPLDDEFTVALERVDDRSSNKTRSSKGKRPADRGRDRDRLSRTVSRATLLSTATEDEYKYGSSNPVSPSSVEDAVPVPSLEDLQREEERAEREEHEEIQRRRRAAAQLAVEKGLSMDDQQAAETVDEAKDEQVNPRQEDLPSGEPTPKVNRVTVGNFEAEEVDEPKPPTLPEPSSSSKLKRRNGELRTESTFVPARLPHFG